VALSHGKDASSAIAIGEHMLANGYGKVYGLAIRPAVLAVG